MQNALTIGNAEQLYRDTHTIKGDVGYFYAKAAVDAATQLERSVRSGNFSTAGKELAELNIEIERLLLALDVLLRTELSQ